MFLETPRFPVCPSFGATSDPNLSVTVSTTAAGFENRNRNWSRFLLDYTCTVGPRERDVETLRDFMYAVGGQECGFRFKDFADYKSCFLADTPTAFDQPTETIAGSPGGGTQLIKVYTAGNRSQTRFILKPVQGTIKIGDDGNASIKTEGVHYALDYTTGLLSLFFTPVGNVTWGGEFDVPVRFNSGFPIDLMNYKMQTVQFALRELRDPT